MLVTSHIISQVAPIADKYELERVEIFGSYANGNATEQSDIDFLVKFKKDTPSIFKVAGLQYELQKALNISVDVVTLPIVNPKLKIERVIVIYEKSGRNAY